MEMRMLASFTDELRKIAEGEIAGVTKPSGNVMNVTKPAVGGKGSNIMGKPLPSSGLSTGTTNLATAKPARPTNYTMVHSNAPMAAFDGGAGAKSVPPPLVET